MSFFSPKPKQTREMMSEMMMGYSKINGRRGFRLNPIRRLTVQRLRSRMVYVFRVLRRSWRSSYGEAIRSLKRCIKNSNNNSKSSRRGLMADECRIISYGRSNSFYSEAIADCLEFIKSSSIPVDQKQVN